MLSNRSEHETKSRSNNKTRHSCFEITRFDADRFKSFLVNCFKSLLLFPVSSENLLEKKKTFSDHFENGQHATRLKTACFSMKL